MLGCSTKNREVASHRRNLGVALALFVGTALGGDLSAAMKEFDQWAHEKYTAVSVRHQSPEEIWVALNDATKLQNNFGNDKSEKAALTDIGFCLSLKYLLYAPAAKQLKLVLYQHNVRIYEETNKRSSMLPAGTKGVDSGACEIAWKSPGIK